MKIDKIVPTLRVKDARKSEQFYCETLGFTKDWEHQFGPEFPLLMSVNFTNCNILLSEHIGTGSDNCDIYVHVDDVDGFYEEKIQQGLVFEKSPVDEPWGARGGIPGPRQPSVYSRCREELTNRHLHQTRESPR